MKLNSWLLAAALNACGGSPSTLPATPAQPDPAVTSPAEPVSDTNAKATASAPAPVFVPRECAKGSRLCLPDRAFTKRMCEGSFPSIALYLFGNGLPFAHGYLTRKTEAWNAEGGASDNGYLEFDEEVLLLVERSAGNGMQVSGAGGGYEALRWNGSCVTLAKEELTLDKPPSPKFAKVEWRFLDDNVQAALREDETIDKAVVTRRKECKGAVSGDVSLACVKADDKLTYVIVDHLRKGGKLPQPSKLPK